LSGLREPANLRGQGNTRLAMTRTLAVITALFAIGAVARADPPQQPPSCFFVHETWTWKAPDSHTMYIRVFPNRYFRLDLAAQCPSLMWPTARLLNVRRSDNVCTALDWDLQVSPGTGSPASPCLVKKMTALTPAEAAQIPDKFRPN
jgi:hypothetical protein